MTLNCRFNDFFDGEWLHGKGHSGYLCLVPRVENFNSYIELVMPEIKQLADCEEDTTVKWAPLNKFFLNVLQMNMLEE